MREIKFRAWIKKTDEVVYFTSSQNSEIHITSNNSFWSVIDGRSRLGGNADDSAILMQYTGLKDKKGVEIYEGDIVKSKSHNPENYELRFIEGGFCCVWGEGQMPIDINHFYPSIGTDLVIIGNIHENPELFKK